MLAVCAVGIHLSIGSVYAWSQIAVSITKQFPNQWSFVQITLCFSIAIVCLGIATLFLGHFIDRRGTFLRPVAINYIKRLKKAKNKNC